MAHQPPTADPVIAACPELSRSWDPVASGSRSRITETKFGKPFPACLLHYNTVVVEKKLSCSLLYCTVFAYKALGCQPPLLLPLPLFYSLPRIREAPKLCLTPAGPSPTPRKCGGIQCMQGLVLSVMTHQTSLALTRSSTSPAPATRLPA